MQVRIPAVYMRGGTSKGLFFHRDHLPVDPTLRDRVILAAYGSPDPGGRQLDGIGGGSSVTSKVAIINPSRSPGQDVEYLFGQVSIDKPVVSYKGNCGNMSAAVGPFAVDEGLVPPEEPVTTVRILQVNTGKSILAEVPVREGKYDPEGNYSIDGVPGTGGRITLRFLHPEGSVTGRLLPTGNLRDTLEVQCVGEVTVSILDAGNPVVFVRAQELGLRGTETQQIEESSDLKDKLEAIRGAAAVMLGLASTPQEASQRSQTIPKIAIVAPPATYRSLSGSLVEEEKIDLVARIMSMGGLHRAYAVTGAICTAGAAMIPGTVVHEMLRDETRSGGKVRLGHPSGRIEIEAFVEESSGLYQYVEARLGRTARRLMDGYVYVPGHVFS
ncbi:MAG: 2-methylaconitate cis-trans isomerase PrpF family protein [Thermodesulfobacteriota bacterium]